jgi:hypothetical protein
MKEAITFGVYMSFFGAISSVIGAFIGAIFNINSKAIISFLYQQMLNNEQYLNMYEIPKTKLFATLKQLKYYLNY